MERYALGRRHGGRRSNTGRRCAWSGSWRGFSAPARSQQLVAWTLGPVKKKSLINTPLQQMAEQRNKSNNGFPTNLAFGMTIAVFSSSTTSWTTASSGMAVFFFFLASAAVVVFLAWVAFRFRLPAAEGARNSSPRSASWRRQRQINT